MYPTFSTKIFLVELTSASFLSIGASSVSGFFAAACSLPFDYVKTQIQKMQPDAEGKYPYTGSFDCAMKTLKAGGPLKFYTGFPVYCVRIAPHVMVLSLSLSLNLDLLGKQWVFHLFSTVCLLVFLDVILIFCCLIMQMTWIFLNQIQKLEAKVGL